MHYRALSEAPATLANQNKRPMALRYVLALLAISVFINYIDRGNLSIAAPMLKDELGMTGSQLGILLSAFFWTYGVAQILSGWLVDRFSVSWIMAIACVEVFKSAPMTIESFVSIEDVGNSLPLLI